ncbi:hypothetical protein PN466_09015 [Roseofilum reptotaenium CS-1145]|uniref:hypothetical protein n=1 Tax=Roseofilum reptotaenium TaxID=1233427 RepID=UPI00232BFBA2|nr:hypothetical protein [Roseofilum reptotaenium]MDB9517087.1 hypothetical protein [Roseofilum reptotaenium CS-1145]
MTTSLEELFCDVVCVACPTELRLLLNLSTRLGEATAPVRSEKSQTAALKKPQLHLEWVLPPSA